MPTLETQYLAHITRMQAIGAKPLTFDQFFVRAIAATWMTGQDR